MHETDRGKPCSVFFTASEETEDFLKSHCMRGAERKINGVSLYI